MMNVTGSEDIFSPGIAVASNFISLFLAGFILPFALIYGMIWYMSFVSHRTLFSKLWLVLIWLIAFAIPFIARYALLDIFSYLAIPLFIYALLLYTFCVTTFIIVCSRSHSDSST